MNQANDDIPEKTASGAQEIRRRALGLPARLRTLLLLVDGIKSLSELKILLPGEADLAAALAGLAQQGLIRFRSTIAGTRQGSIEEPASPPLRETGGPDDRQLPREALSETTSGLPEEQRVGTGSGLLRARAHIANALDEFSGYKAYLLRQQVATCASAAALEALYGEVENELRTTMDAAGAAAVLRRARALIRVGDRSP